MATIAEALAAGASHQQAGRLSEAEDVCRWVLGVDENQVGAWYVLGGIACQRGEYAAARECLQRAILLMPEFAEAHCNLGTALQGLGRLDEAVNCFGRAAELRPDFADAHFNLGNVLRLQGKLDEAIHGYRRALTVKPSFAEAYSNQAAVYFEQGRLDEAADCYSRALALRPELADAHNGLGTTLQQQKKLDAAIACYRRAVELSPDFSQAHSNLGLALSHQGKLAEAAACLQRAVELAPELAAAHNNWGNVLRVEDKIDEALAYYHRALSLDPEFAEAHHNLGIAHLEKGEFDTAAACYRRALALRPDFPAAHVSLAVLRLLLGDFQAGWPEYEWRWKTGQLPSREFVQPVWDGRALDGRLILLHAEQGLGDTLQFIRYAAVVKGLGGTVCVECQPALVPLLASCPGIDRLVAKGDELPRFDVHAPLLSLPSILQTSRDSIPNETPYLFAASALVEKWRGELSKIEGFRIGINWQGRAEQLESRKRNFSLDCLAAVAQLPGVRLINLQKGVGRQELADARLSVIDLGNDVDIVNGAFMDTAAIMMNLDLVITSDTSIAHLAGALGVPVWAALSFVADWRWLLGRSDCPWYPTMRLFRQKMAGDWAGVFEEMEGTLRERLGESS